MSGYLQRLAGSVMKPKETVRPLLGSIYAGSTATSAQDSFENAEQDSARLISSQMISSADEGARPGDVNVRRDEVVETQDLQQPETAVANKPQEPGRPTSNRSKLDEEEVSGLEYAAQRKGIYIPLLTTSSAEPLKQTMSRVPEGFSSSVQNTKHKATSAQSTQREPDDIQIHIGRIEVSAVPQPTPVAVTRTPRTPSSLDEYLQRRDRRRT